MRHGNGLGISRETLDALRPYGNFARIPEEVLKRHRLIRINDEESDTVRLMPSRTYGELCGCAISLMKRHEGYIFADYLKRMRGLLNKKRIISIEEMRFTDWNARNLKQNSIPPIFDERYYMPTVFTYHVGGRRKSAVTRRSYHTLFPAVDLIIQFGAGTFESRSIAAAAKLLARNERRDKMGMSPTTYEDVRLFRRQAFDSSGHIDRCLIGEIRDYVSNKFNHVSEERLIEILEWDDRIFRFLEEQLASLTAPRRHTVAWDGDVSVVHDRRWYLEYSEEDRERILAAYYASLQGLPVGKDRATKRRLEALFGPDKAPSASELLNRRYAADRLSAENTLKRDMQERRLLNVPRWVFTDAAFLARHQSEMEAVVAEIVYSYGKQHPDWIYGDVQNMDADIPMRTDVFSVPFVRRVINEQRLRIAKEMDDSLFRQHFCGTHTNRGSALGRALNGNPDEAARNLRTYLFERRQSLRQQ